MKPAAFIRITICVISSVAIAVASFFYNMHEQPNIARMSPIGSWGFVLESIVIFIACLLLSALVLCAFRDLLSASLIAAIIGGLGTLYWICSLCGLAYSVHSGNMTSGDSIDDAIQFTFIYPAGLSAILILALGIVGLRRHYQRLVPKSKIIPPAL